MEIDASTGSEADGFYMRVANPEGKQEWNRLLAECLSATCEVAGIVAALNLDHPLPVAGVSTTDSHLAMAPTVQPAPLMSGAQVS